MAGTSYNGPAFESGDLKELKQKLVDGCHILDHEGITDGFGHVSVRVPGSEAFLTIAGVSPGCATLERLVMLDFDGRYLGGEKSPPYEWPIHACIMRARPEVMSVCHTHSKWSSLFSVVKGGLRPVHMYAKFSPRRRPADLPGVRPHRHRRTRYGASIGLER
jgi:ribulose-5-phosphate 4-epimerase/fuculose-1-phosphate aldolase